MPIPALVDDWLPVGIHECTLDELQQRFGRFQGTDVRCRMFDRFADFVTEVRKCSFVSFLLIDGSFITAKQHPNDIDLILVLRQDHDMSALLRPYEYNVVSKRYVRRLYGLDLLVAQEGSLQLTEYTEFFAQIRGIPDARKGLLKLTP